MQINGTGIVCDRFSRGGAAYFLSHLHADHTQGLCEGWDHGPLYCSRVTAALLKDRYGLDGGIVHVVDPGETAELNVDGRGMRVRAMEANHCPGAVMFHFETDGRRVLYTGDFRLDDDIRAHADNMAGVDLAYIDSTYNEPHYRFPSQEESIESVLQHVAEHMGKEVFLAVYTIGKTKVLRAVREEFDLPVYVSNDMAHAYDVMGLGNLVTRDRDATNLRGYFRGYFYRYFRYKHRRHRNTHAVIIPTGWAVDAEGDQYGYIYVPYSEHCDYAELCEFKQLLRPKEVVAI